MTHIVFLGSPEFAVPTLRKLNEQFQVVGVITQPDRPAGRGRILTSPPVRLCADELGLPVIQPRKISELDALHQIHTWAPEIIVVAAFGQILRSEVLDLPIYGCVNVHASFLPRWRGAAPIQAAILNGDEQTGITIMRMDPGIDTGPILNQVPLQLSRVETAGALGSTLSILGADLLVKTLPGYLDGTLSPIPQDDSLATYAPMIKKEAGLLDFSQSATYLERKVRAFNPWPGAYTFWNNGMLKIHRTHITEGVLAPPGKRIIHEKLPAYTTGHGILVIDFLQPAGKNPMDGVTFLRGARGWEE
jgi:methionyl-tRNA formyltransferase